MADRLITASTALGNAAFKNVGTTAGTVAAGDDTRIVGALQASGNLFSLTNPATARTNLGLATVAASGAYADLSGKPTLFDGAWASLSGKPSLFDGTWSSLSGKPTFSTVATSGAYADLSGKPTLGGAAALNVGTGAGTVAAGDDSRFTAPGAWTAFTPTVTSSSGTITSASATGWYQKTGKAVDFTMTITNTTSGSGTGSVLATLPTPPGAALRATAFSGVNNSNGAVVAARCSAGGTNLQVTAYQGGYPVLDGQVMIISGRYEVA